MADMMLIFVAGYLHEIEKSVLNGIEMPYDIVQLCLIFYFQREEFDLLQHGSNIKIEQFGMKATTDTIGSGQTATGSLIVIPESLLFNP